MGPTAYAMSVLVINARGGRQLLPDRDREGQSSLPRPLRRCLMRDGDWDRPESILGEGPTF